MSSAFIDCGGVRLSVTRAGAGEPVLFLHGFPELARYWAPLVRRLAPSFDCITPDLRGYGASDKPAATEDYAVDRLLGDVVALIDALGFTSVNLAGHDWGGVLAWWFAARHPDRVRSLTVFNAPHPVALQRRFDADGEQRLRSGYIRRLQQPGAAAQLLAAGPASLWDRLRGDGAGFDAGDRAAYIAAWSEGLEGPVAWYRASPFHVPEGDAPHPPWTRDDLHVRCKTLIVWGQEDGAFVPALADDSAQFASRVWLRRLPGVRHNPPRETPGLCARLMRAFMAAEPETGVHAADVRENEEETA
jgi:epoxide hydrolase 4